MLIVIGLRNNESLLKLLKTYNGGARKLRDEFTLADM